MPLANRSSSLLTSHGNHDNKTDNSSLYLCTGSLDLPRCPISIESTEELKIVTAVALCKHIGIKKQSVFEEKCICKWNDTFTRWV